MEPTWHGEWFPKTFLRKRDVPRNYIARRVNFGLYGLRWCAFIGNDVMTKTGEMAPIFEAYLNTGRVIGPRDITSMDKTKHAEGWRSSLSEHTIKLILGK